MSTLGAAYTKGRLCLDFRVLKHACPSGVYVAPVPEESLSWAGILFVRTGPYSNAVLRFRVDFPAAYPALPPIVTILNDVFHPLVTPLTTYSYSTRDTGAETASAADSDRLPPGGLSLKQGFPEWFGTASAGVENKAASNTLHGDQEHNSKRNEEVRHLPLTVELLQYLRIVFSTDALLDSVPLEAAANTGAWHAWRSYRSKTIGTGTSRRSLSGASDATSERSTSPRQQPGSARKPGEWNWQGVWEDRVKKSVQASISESALYGGDSNDVLSFSKMDADDLRETMAALKELEVT